MVDAKVLEIKLQCGTNREKIKALLRHDYGITL